MTMQDYNVLQYLHFLLLFDTNKRLFLNSSIFCCFFGTKYKDLSKFLSVPSPLWYNVARSCCAPIYPFLLLFDTNKKIFLNSFLFLLHFYMIMQDDTVLQYIHFL